MQQRLRRFIERGIQNDQGEIASPFRFVVEVTKPDLLRQLRLRLARSLSGLSAPSRLLASIGSMTSIVGTTV
jgi:hypothetical protein